MLKGLGGLGGLGDMAKMMKTAGEMQTKMAELQSELSQTILFGEAGAGLVKARVTAKGELVGLDIDPAILVASEKEVVEDLIIAAIKEAQAKGAQRSQTEMQKMAQALGLPADMKLPF